MLSCRNTTRLISEELDRSLSCGERLRLGVHLLLCPPCQRFRRAVHFLHRALPSLPDDTGLPDDARARIRRALEEASRDK
jgi:hypothetical protein